MQSPWTHCGIAHVALVQVCAQSLCRQVIEHEPPVHCCVHPPWAHCIEQVALSQICWQSLSAHVPAHVDPDGHVYWQSLRSPAHVSEQAAPTGQLQDSPASGHEKLRRAAVGHDPGGLGLVLLLQAPSISSHVTRRRLSSMTET